MRSTVALFLGGPWHGEMRAMPSGQTEISVMLCRILPGTYEGCYQQFTYEMGGGYEDSGPYAGAIHFRLKNEASN